MRMCNLEIFCCHQNQSERNAHLYNQCQSRFIRYLYLHNLLNRNSHRCHSHVSIRFAGRNHTLYCRSPWRRGDQCSTLVLILRFTIFWVYICMYCQDVTRPRSKSLPWAAELGVEGTVQRALYAGRNFNPVAESFHNALQGAVDQAPCWIALGSGYWNSKVPVAAKRGHCAIVELLLATDPLTLTQMSEMNSL
jgi:hypothetical protein